MDKIQIRQLFDYETCTYTYVLWDFETKDAIIIDPVLEQVERDFSYLKKLKLNLKYILETHIHADHITGASKLKQKTNAEICYGSKTGVEGADILLDDGDKITIGSIELCAIHTPGHTEGCVTYVLRSKKMVFTGDCLLIRGCGRTDFQGGDAAQLYRSIHDHIFTLPEDFLIYPGHDYKGLTSTSVLEEKFFNPRLGGQLSEQDFIGFMSNLGLDHPKKIDTAIPANLKCGRPKEDIINIDQPTWAELSLTFAGFWEVEPHWLVEHPDVAQIIDVREEDEFNGTLGHIVGARQIALSQLKNRVDELNYQQPIITICRAGGRSAQATVILHKAGFQKVANLAGGMLRWREYKYPINECTQ